VRANSGSGKGVGIRSWPLKVPKRVIFDGVFLHKSSLTRL
jgi:hypothetical protein